MKKVNHLGQDCWADENGNKWICELHSEEEAERLSKTLDRCFDCEECEECTKCSKCDFCKDCFSCEYCDNCINCMLCDDCSSLLEEILLQGKR